METLASKRHLIMVRATNAEGVRYFQPKGWSAATTLGLQVNSFIKPCKGSAIGERFQRFATTF